MTKRFALAMLLSLGLAGAACAQAMTLGTRDLNNVTSGTYKLDSSHANVVFKVNHLGFSEYVGRFNKIEGTLQFDAKTPEKSKVSVSIDAASVDTNNAKLEGELRAADCFNTEKFPTITFTSTSIQKTGDYTGLITGDLTFLGVTKPVTLNATYIGGGKHPMGGKPVVGFSAATKFKRSEFGMNKFIPAVSDEVSLTIDAEFAQ